MGRSLSGLGAQIRKTAQAAHPVPTKEERVTASGSGFSGPAIDQGLLAPNLLDVRVGNPSKRQTTVTSHLAVRAGFVDEWDYELRCSFTPQEAKTAFLAFKEAHVSLVIRADVKPADSHAVLNVYAGSPDNLAYQYQLKIDY